MVKVNWTIWWDGMNPETLNKEGTSYRKDSYDCIEHSDTLTKSMKRFKKMFYEQNHKSQGLRPVRYDMEIITDNKIYRIERTSTEWETQTPEKVTVRRREG